MEEVFSFFHETIEVLFAAKFYVMFIRPFDMMIYIIVFCRPNVELVQDFITHVDTKTLRALMQK